MTGKKIKHYQIHECIGSGAMGTVYRAYDANLDRDVAIKFLTQTGQPSEAATERFYREARAAARLSHHNVVTIHDVGDHEGACYFVMELLAGASLRQVIDEKRPMDWRQKLDIVLQVCQGLEVAHGEGLLHRDIKADNIWVTLDGTVKVLDFGIARTSTAKALTMEGDTLGTPEYMAPEQIMGGALDERTDLYALGVQMYELFTGKLPFTGPNPMTVIYKHMEEEPAPPGQLAKDVPMVVDEMVLRAMEKDPDRRFQSVHDLQKAIEDLLNGTGEEVLKTTHSGPELEMARTLSGEVCRLAGRREELDRLHSAVDALKKDQGNTIFIGGEAGIGKTRLAREVLDYARHRGAMTLSGTCLYAQGTEPYLPFLEALGQGLGVENEVERQKILSFIRKEAPELEAMASQLMTAIRTRRTMIDSGSDDAVASSRERLFEAITQVLLFLSRRSPVVILLDDLHWADNATLQLLYYISREAQSQRLLLLCTYRGEDLLADATGDAHPLIELMQSMGRETLYDKLELGALSQQAVDQMLRDLFKRRAFSSLFRESLYQETGGNPLFVLEVLMLLREEGVLYQHNGVWREKREITRADIPERVLDVVRQRLARLSDEERDLLQIASISGRSFTSDALAQIAELKRMQVLKALNRLEQRHQLIRSQDKGYGFEHEKVREILYGELSAELLQAYHLAYGEYLETAGDRSSLSERASHYYHGEAFDKALPLLVEAAKRAGRLFAFREARDCYRWALDCLEQVGDVPEFSRPVLQLEYGITLENMGHPNRAEDAFLVAEETALKAGDFRTAALAQCRIALVFLSRGDRGLAAKQFRNSAHHFQKVGDSAGLCNVLVQTAMIPFEEGNWKRVHAYYDRVLKIADKNNLPSQSGIVYMNLGIIATIQGETTQAEALLEKSRETFENIRDWKNLAKVWINKGWMLERLKDWDRVEDAYRKALLIAKKTRNVYQEAECHLNLAQVLLETADVAGCKRSCLRALEIFEKVNPLGVADVYKTLGEAAAVEHKWDDAQTYFLKAIEKNDDLSHALGSGSSRLAYAYMLRDADKLKKAVVEADAAKVWFEKIDAQEELKEVEVLQQDLDALIYLAKEAESVV